MWGKWRSALTGGTSRGTHIRAAAVVVSFTSVGAADLNAATWRANAGVATTSPSSPEACQWTHLEQPCSSGGGAPVCLTGAGMHMLMSEAAST